MPITLSKTWNASYQKSISLKLLFTPSLAKTLSKRNILESHKISSRWSEPHHPSAIQFQEDNAWPNASSFLSSMTMSLFTWSLLDHISSMMMTSTGTSVLHPQLQKSSKKLRKLCYKFKMKNISKITFIYHGFVDAISWTLNLISHGKSTSIWKLQTSHSNYLIWLPMIAIRWGNSTIPSKHSMFWKDLIQTPNSGKVKEVPQLVFSKWLLPAKSRGKDLLRSFKCLRTLTIHK